MIGPRPDRPLTGAATTGRFAVLTMGDLSLLIPQHQVQTLEPAFDVRRSDGDELGWILVAGVSSPVYCLSEDLQPLREVPAGRHICVLLDLGSSLVGILCDEVDTLAQAAIELLPLPACMRTPATPLHGLVLQGEQVMCVTSAQDLLACVGAQDLEPLPQPALKTIQPRLMQGGAK